MLIFLQEINVLYHSVSLICVAVDTSLRASPSCSEAIPLGVTVFVSTENHFLVYNNRVMSNLNTFSMPTEAFPNKAYKTTTTSQKIDWEKIFALGDTINTSLRMTEQQIVDDVRNFRKRRNS